MTYATVRGGSSHAPFHSIAKECAYQDIAASVRITTAGLNRHAPGKRYGVGVEGLSRIYGIFNQNDTRGVVAHTVRVSYPRDIPTPDRQGAMSHCRRR